MKQLNDLFPPLKKRKLSKKAHEKEDDIKTNMWIENQNYNDWKF